MPIHGRFGDARAHQSKLQKHKQLQPGSGNRRRDTSIHATSRPWHTSAPGIKMNISTLGQIASKDRVAARYLNMMHLSEMAQKKRGIKEKDEGRGYDKMGMAMLHGLRKSVVGRASYGGPNADTINRWQASISGKEQLIGGRQGTKEEQAHRDRGGAGGRTLHDRQVDAIIGYKKKIPKQPFHYSGVNMHHKYQH